MTGSLLNDRLSANDCSQYLGSMCGVKRCECEPKMTGLRFKRLLSVDALLSVNSLLPVNSRPRCPHAACASGLGGSNTQ